MASKFTPLHDRILVRRIEEGESIRGGIIIPDSAKEKPQQGEVVSVGKGKSANASSLTHELRSQGFRLDRVYVSATQSPETRANRLYRFALKE